MCLLAQRGKQLKKRGIEMKRFIVTADKKTAALYFAWEFGIKNAVRFAKQQATNGHIINPITGIASPRSCKTRREAESIARRVREAAAYMQGRIGKKSFGGTVNVLAEMEQAK